MSTGHNWCCSPLAARAACPRRGSRAARRAWILVRRRGTICRARLGTTGAARRTATVRHTATARRTATRTRAARRARTRSALRPTPTRLRAPCPSVTPRRFTTRTRLNRNWKLCFYFYTAPEPRPCCAGYASSSNDDFDSTLIFQGLLLQCEKENPNYFSKIQLCR